MTAELRTGDPSGDTARIEQGRQGWEADRRERLAALTARLPDHLTQLMPYLMQAAQQAVDEDMRPDGTLTDPEALGERVVYALAPLLEHGTLAGWCPRCGESAVLGEYRVCGPCEAAEGWGEGAPRAALAGMLVLDANSDD